VAQASTIYIVTIDLADMDRGVYESFELRVARHPSETGEFMLARILAYCLEYTDGIEMTSGLSTGDEPALVVRDLTGRITAWIEVGLPACCPGAGATHRDVRQLLSRLEGEKIHRGDEMRIRAFDRGAMETIAALLDRRSSFSLNVAGGELHLSLGDQMFTVAMTEHRVDAA